MCKVGIFDAGFGEILRSPHLQWAGKRKFAPRFTKPSVTDPTLVGQLARKLGYLLAPGPRPSHSGRTSYMEKGSFLFGSGGEPAENGGNNGEDEE